VDKLAESYNQVDVLVNNAAAGLGDLAQVKRSADSHQQSPGPVVRWPGHFHRTKFLECYAFILSSLSQNLWKKFCENFQRLQKLIVQSI
jgi:hypothetical protein